MDAPELTRGPGWMRAWAAKVAAAIKANKPTAGIGISVNESGSGIAISESKQSNKENESGGDDGGGESGGETETVIGAVNGVPATLNVMTDGSGWVGLS
jgi:hypothetical protein